MKKIIITLYALTSFALIGIAQTCVPDITVTTAGLHPAPASASCFEQGVDGSMVITLKNFITAGPGGAYNVDSVIIDSITNIPCGLKYSLSPTNKKLLTGEAGCISIHGITNEPVGQYQIRIYGKVYGTPVIPIYQGVSAALDILATLNTPPLDYRYWVRVKSAGGSCPTLDTSPTSTANKTASCKANENTGIKDITNAYSNISLAPNPVINNLVISFESAKNSAITYTISSISGQVIKTAELNVNAGANELEIDATALNSGTYFITLVDGSSSVTRKFVKN